MVTQINDLAVLQLHRVNIVNRTIQNKGIPVKGGRSFSPRTGKQPFYCFFSLITVDIFCFGGKTVFDRFRSLNHREGLKALEIKRNVTLGFVVILEAVVKYYAELYIRHDLALEVIGDRITDTPAIMQRTENLYHPK